MFRCAASDPPLGFSDLSPDISGHSGACPAGLRQQCVGRSSDLPNAPPSFSAGVQHAAAWLIFNLKRSDHITDALISLHWLRIPERIRYKVAVLTYKVLHGSAPRYLGPLVRVADLPGRHALRSAGTNRLVVPSVKHSTVGSRSFPVAGPRSGMVCRRKLRLRSRCRFFASDSKLFCFSFRLPLLDCCFIV